MLQDEEHHHKASLHQLLSRAARRLGFRWYDMYYVERGLHRPIPDLETDRPLRFHVATDEDRGAILRARPRRQHRRLELHFESERTVCYVASSDAGLAGYSMLKSGLMDLTGLDAVEVPVREMPDDVGLTHDSYVWPESRGQKVFHALLSYVYRDRRDAGLRAVCNLIDPANVSSLKVHLDLGARIQRVRFAKLPGTGAIVVGRDFEIGRLDPPDPA